MMKKKTLTRCFKFKGHKIINIFFISKRQHRNLCWCFNWEIRRNLLEYWNNSTFLHVHFIIFSFFILGKMAVLEVLSLTRMVKLLKNILMLALKFVTWLFIFVVYILQKAIKNKIMKNNKSNNIKHIHTHTYIYIYIHNDNGKRTRITTLLITELY